MLLFLTLFLAQFVACGVILRKVCRKPGITGESRVLYILLWISHIANCSIIANSTLNPLNNGFFYFFDILGNFCSITTIPYIYLLISSAGGATRSIFTYLKHLWLPYTYAILFLILFFLITNGYCALPRWWHSLNVTTYNCILVSQVLYFSLSIFLLNFRFTTAYKKSHSSTNTPEYRDFKRMLRLSLPFFICSYFMLLIRLSSFYNRIWLALLVILPMTLCVYALGLALLRVRPAENMDLPEQKRLTDVEMARLRDWLIARKENNTVLESKYLDDIIKHWQESEAKFYLMPGITLQRVASQMNIPQRELSSYLNNSQKMNFNSWINSLRIQEVKRLLVQDELTLEEIATKCGFSDRSQLIRVFKKMEGCTPSKFRTVPSEMNEE